MKPDIDNTGVPLKKKAVISKGIDSFFLGIYNVYSFIIRFFKQVFSPPFEFKEIINQCYDVGYRSLPLVSLTGFITGLNKIPGRRKATHSRRSS